MTGDISILWPLGVLFLMVALMGWTYAKETWPEVDEILHICACREAVELADRMEFRNACDEARAEVKAQVRPVWGNTLTEDGLHVSHYIKSKGTENG